MNIIFEVNEEMNEKKMSGEIGGRKENKINRLHSDSFFLHSRGTWKIDRADERWYASTEGGESESEHWTIRLP